MSVEAEAPQASDGFTVTDLWSIASIHRWMIGAAAGLGLAVMGFYSLVATRQYTAVAVVHVTSAAGQEIATDPIGDGRAWNRAMLVQTQMAIMESYDFRRKVLQRYLEVGANDGWNVDDSSVSRLGSVTEIKVRQGTELLDISVTTTDPDRAAKLANLTAEVFEDENLEDMTRKALGAKAWLVNQIGEYEDRIAEASDELLTYQRANDMVDPTGSSAVLDAQLGSLRGAYGEANTARVTHEAMVRSHEELWRRGQVQDLAKDMATPVILSLSTSFAQALASHAEVAAVFGEKMPEFKNSKSRLDRIEAELRTEVSRTLSAERARLEVLKTREAELLEALGGGKEMLLDVEGRREDFDKRKLELDSAKEVYAKLKERLTEMDLQSKTQLNNVQIRQQARPPKRPSSPNVKLNLLLGLIGGLGLGFVGAFLREFLNDSVATPQDVETFLHTSFLGFVPHVDPELTEKDGALYSYHHPRSNIAEAVRALRTTLELNPKGRAPEILLVTSAMASEGKTSTSVRLGIAYASLGRSVLLIDADLRRPKVHKVFQQQRQPGLTTALLTELEVLDAIRETEVPGFSILPAGKGVEHPNEMLASKAFQDVLRGLHEAYDLVIIDSPPSALVADARILSRYVDGVLVVVREQVTSRGLAREAIRGLENVGARVLGVCLNGVDSSRRRANYYGYHYGYGYGYGYRYESSPEEEEESGAA